MRFFATSVSEESVDYILRMKYIHHIDMGQLCIHQVVIYGVPIIYNIPG